MLQKVRSYIFNGVVWPRGERKNEIESRGESRHPVEPVYSGYPSGPTELAATIIEKWPDYTGQYRIALFGRSWFEFTLPLSCHDCHGIQ